MSVIKMDFLSNFVEKISALSDQTKQPVIFVAGLGASGKTTLCKKLTAHFGDGVVIESDWFLSNNSEDRRQKIASGEMLENPSSWYDWESMIDAVQILKEKKTLALQKAWNQKTGIKDLNITMKLNADAFTPIFVDGIYLLHPEINQHADLTILLDANLDTLQARRTMRDGHRSSPEYLAKKAEWAKKYDIPYFEKHRNQADIIADAG